MSIVITGNPGTGKHTILNEIKNSVSLPVLDINEYARECGLLEKNDDTSDVDTEKLSKKIQEKITKPHIIVGHLAPYAIRGIPIKTIIVLRRDPRELALVYKQRRYNEKKTKDNLGSEILGVTINDTIQNLKNENIVQVDVTGRNISETGKVVLDAINGKSASQTIDWLGSINPTELKDYFSYD